MTSDIYSDRPQTPAVPAAPSTGLPTPPLPPGSATPPTGAGPSEDSSTAETAKSEAQNVATTAVDSGAQVLDTVKAETGEVLAQAGQSARTLFEQVRGELTDQAGTQQQRVASGLHDLADELDQMGRSSQQAGQSGLAASLVKQASDRTRSTADWMSHREPGDLVTEVKRFAARKPGTFLAAAAALGFLGARLTRGLTASAESDKTKSTTTTDVPAVPADNWSQPGLSPVTTEGAAGVSGYPTEEVLPSVPSVTTISHGQPVTYPSGDAAAHPRLSPTPPAAPAAPPAPSFRDISDIGDVFDGTTGAAEGRP